MKVLYGSVWGCCRNCFVEGPPSASQGSLLASVLKLEMPIRALVQLINQSQVLEHNQVVVLWKTPTIMAPQAQREFDEQITTVARRFYFKAGWRFVSTLHSL